MNEKLPLKIVKHYANTYRISGNGYFGQIKKDEKGKWNADIRKSESGDLQRFAGIWSKKQDAVEEVVSLLEKLEYGGAVFDKGEKPSKEMTQAEFDQKYFQIQEEYRKAYNLTNQEIGILSELAQDGAWKEPEGSLQDYLGHFSNYLEAQVQDYISSKDDEGIIGYAADMGMIGYYRKKKEQSDNGELNVKGSLEAYKPQIEERFKSIVTSTFENMVKALGPKLKGAFNHSSFAHFMRIGTPVRSSLQTDSEGVYSINTGNLDKLAKQYATDTIEKWAEKIQSKVGELENAEVNHLDGFRFSIKGTRNGKNVNITQDMIVNSSSKGTLFNQFPARIYVNGKNVPESRYQEVVESKSLVDAVKLISRIRKASQEKKTKIWQDADLTREQGNEIVRQMVLSVPPGHYKLHDRTYGTNLVDTVWEMYGWMPSMLAGEPMMLGLQATHPEKVYASFTLGLDAIEIKK